MKEDWSHKSPWFLLHFNKVILQLKLFEWDLLTFYPNISNASSDPARKELFEIP